jgi:hypothetical protein
VPVSETDVNHIRRAFVEFNQRYDTLRDDALEPNHAELVRVSGRPADDPVVLEVALGITYEMRDGRIGYVRVHVGHERALDSASSGG